MKCKSLTRAVMSAALLAGLSNLSWAADDGAAAFAYAAVGASALDDGQSPDRLPPAGRWRLVLRAVPLRGAAARRARGRAHDHHL